MYKTKSAPPVKEGADAMYLVKQFYLPVSDLGAETYTTTIIYKYTRRVGCLKKTGLLHKYIFKQNGCLSQYFFFELLINSRTTAYRFIEKNLQMPGENGGML